MNSSEMKGVLVRDKHPIYLESLGSTRTKGISWCSHRDYAAEVPISMVQEVLEIILATPGPTGHKNIWFQPYLTEDMT